MTNQDIIYILQEPCQFQKEIRKSVFLAHAVPVYSEDQADQWLKRLWVPEATHNCWAYRMGQKYRCDDDGEPSGTAGRPILQMIEKRNFDYVLLLVIRWFGGIKLGAGGLIRAYGGTAAECLRNASAELYVPKSELVIICSFSDYSLLSSRVLEYGAQVITEQFLALDVEFTVSVPEENCQLLIERVMDLTRGQVLIEKKD